VARRKRSRHQGKGLNDTAGRPIPSSHNHNVKAARSITGGFHIISPIRYRPF